MSSWPTFPAHSFAKSLGEVRDWERGGVWPIKCRQGLNGWFIGIDNAVLTLVDFAKAAIIAYAQFFWPIIGAPEPRACSHPSGVDPLLYYFIDRYKH